MAPRNLTEDSVGEDTESSTASYHSVAVPAGPLGMSLRVRRPHGDVETSLSPELENPIGVQFGASGFDVDQIAPGEDMNTAKARLRGEGSYI